MGFKFSGHFEGDLNDAVESSEKPEKMEKTEKREYDSEDEYSDDFDKICDQLEAKEQNKDAITEQKESRRIVFSGEADENFDYGKGGARQYFIQDAKELKASGNLIPLSKESCTFNSKTDVYTADIRRDKEDPERLIHLDSRNLNKEELKQLDGSTADDLHVGVDHYDEAEYEPEISKEELDYLDENTVSEEALKPVERKTEGELEGAPSPDYRHPLGDQEESGGVNHPDAWSNPEKLKDGATYYQLLPQFKDGHESPSSYFTDKETVDSCRDEKGKIDLAALMQKLQKSPNMEEIVDEKGSKHTEYVRKYSVIEYQYKENA